MDTDPRGSTPVPDPTVLTTQQLGLSVSALREFIATTRELLETRLDAMDTATRLNKEQMNNIPRLIDEKLTQFKDLTLEKFHSIETQFKERDTRTEQSSKDSKVAVDAALQAAKEAVGEQNKSSALAIAKSEASTNKQLDQIGTLINSTNKALDEKINDLKGRLDRGEGQQFQKSNDKDQHNWVVGLVVTCILALLGNAITLVFLFTHIGK